MLPNLETSCLGNCHLWPKVMKLTCAKTGNVKMCPNQAHFVVAYSGKDACVLSDCQQWQYICFQIWHILELPGMANVCAQ